MYPSGLLYCCTYRILFFFFAHFIKSSSIWALTFLTTSLHNLAASSPRFPVPASTTCAFSSHHPVWPAGPRSAMPVCCLPFLTSYRSQKGELFCLKESIFKDLPVLLPCQWEVSLDSPSASPHNLVVEEPKYREQARVRQPHQTREFPTSVSDWSSRDVADSPSSRIH